MILKMILKTADIGNVTKGKEVCLGWTERVVDEFFTQGDLEAELKLPVTPFMDRKTADIPKQQIGFYNFIARPMFEALDGLVDMSTPLANLDLMYSHWSSQLPAEAPLPGVRASLVSGRGGACCNRCVLGSRPWITRQWLRCHVCKICPAGVHTAIRRCASERL